MTACSRINRISCRTAVLLVFLMAPLATAAQENPFGNRIRAQLTAYQQTTLSSEIAANISKLPLREGEPFVKDQLLVEFDCALLNAQLNKADATAEVARQGLKVSKRLEELNSISKLEVDQATAKVKETEAEREAMKVNVSKCSLSAPYPGRIAKLHVDAFQYVTSGKPLMDILDTSRLEVRLIVPSGWLAWLKPGGRLICLKGGNLEHEISKALAAKKEHNGFPAKVELHAISSITPFFSDKKIVIAFG